MPTTPYLSREHAVHVSLIHLSRMAEANSPAACTMPANGGNSTWMVDIRRATAPGSATSAARIRNWQPYCSRSRRCAAARHHSEAAVRSARAARRRARPDTRRCPARPQPSPPVTRYVASPRSSSCTIVCRLGTPEQPSNVDRVLPEAIWSSLVPAPPGCGQSIPTTHRHRLWTGPPAHPKVGEVRRTPYDRTPTCRTARVR